MKRSTIIIGAVLAMSLTACQKELQGLQESQEYGFVIEATREACAGDTKATISDAKLAWTAGEQIGIYNGTAFVAVKTLDGGEKASFTSESTLTPSKYAVYPELSAAVSDDNLKVTLPTSYEKYTSGAAYPAMLATFEDTPSSLYFKHLGGLVKFNVTGLPKSITKFIFTTTNDMPVTGEFTVTTDDSSNKVIKSATAEGTAAKTVTYSFENTAESNDMVFYLPLPVLESDAQYKFQIDFQTEAGVSIYTTPKTGWVKVERGKYFEFNLGFTNTEGGSETGTTSVTLGSDVTSYTLPSTDGTVNVTMETNTNDVTIGYVSEGLHPATVNILCKGDIGNATAGTGLTVNLPESHVVIKKADGVTANVTINALSSSTSSSTLVLDKSISEVKTLTVTGGSAEIAVPTVGTVTVEETVSDEATVKVTDENAKVESLTVNKGNVEIAAGTVTNVTVASTVAETATVKVAEGAKIATKLEVAQAGTIEIAGTVPTVTVASTATAPVVTVASTAKIETKLEVANAESVKVEATVASVSVDKASSVEVAGTVDAVAVKTDVSSVTIASAVKTVEVTAASTTTETAPVIWVTESGKVTESVTDKTASSSESSKVTIVAANGTASGDVGNGQVKVVKDNSGSEITNAVKTPADYLKDKIENGGEITLEDNISGDFTVASGRTVTVNLNGKTITNSKGDTFTVALGGSLTIEGDGTVDNITHGKACIYNNGTVALNGGTYTRSKEAGSSKTESGGNSYYNILNHGTMTIAKDVTVKSSGAFSSLIASGYYNYKSTDPRSGYVSGTNAEKPSLTISGGSFTGGINTIKNDDGANLEITGGTFANTTQACIQNNNYATINNGTFNPTGAVAVQSRYFDGGVNAGVTYINGGTFNGSLVSYGGGVFVFGDSFTNSTVYVADEKSLNAALVNARVSTIALYDDIALVEALRAARTLALDLNGKTISPASDWKNWDSSTKTGSDALIIVNRKGDLTIKGNGSIDANGNQNIYAAVKLTEAGEAANGDAATLTITNGTFKGYYYAISGNGTRHDTNLTINGGTFNGNTAIYHPQEGKFTVNGGNFEAVKAAIEFRAGTLNISGGTFTATASEFSKTANGNGTTVVGAALAISQHVTDLDINVNVTGGTFKGVYALYEDDLQNETGNVSVTVDKTKATLTGKVYSKHNTDLNTETE